MLKMEALVQAVERSVAMLMRPALPSGASLGELLALTTRLMQVATRRGLAHGDTAIGHTLKVELAAHCAAEAPEAADGAADAADAAAFAALAKLDALVAAIERAGDYLATR